MRVDITSSGDFSDTINWLNRSKNKIPTSTLNTLGREGVRSLARNTPIGETGRTAAGWKYEVTRESDGAELAFMNVAHPEQSVNIAKIIQLGHGTGTGGYVPPYDYINPSLRRIFDSAGDRMAREMFR